MDRRVEIQYRHVTGQDSTYGRDEVEWLPLVVLQGSPVVAAPLWGQFNEMSGDEAVRNGLDLAKAPGTLTLRWIDNVDSTMRVIIFDPVEQIYAILGSPNMIGRKIGMELQLARFSSGGAST
jgi:head-tail adaptor